MTITRRLLSATAVQQSKTADKDYGLPDGHGLTLSVRASGKKSGVSVISVQIPLPEPISRSAIIRPCHWRLPILFMMNISACWLRGSTRKNWHWKRQSGNRRLQTVCLSTWRQNGLPSKRPVVFPKSMPVISGAHWRRTFFR